MKNLPQGFIGVLPIINLKNFLRIAPMKYRYLAVLAASACINLAPLKVDAQANTVNIMPFGDSITSFGAAPESSYRYWLYVDLTNAHFNNFHFVGSQSGASDGTPANSWPEENYEGGGDDWTTATALSDVGNVVSQSPDIILYEFGDNDYQQWDPSTSRTNIDQTIEGIRASLPNTLIILAIPTHWAAPFDPQARKYMSQIDTAVHQAYMDEKKAGANVVQVNLASGFSPSGDTLGDGVHPNVKGEKMIAKKFFNALRPRLKKM